MSVDFNYPYVISADTAAVAEEVQQNFDQLLQWLKVNYRQVDDTPQMTAQLRLPGEPATDSEAANKGYVDRIVPVGSIFAFGGSTAPAGYALCDGSLQSTTDAAYVDLFGAIGYSYGGAGGSFNLPDLRQKIAVGVGGAGDFADRGNTGGVADQKQLTHSHTINHGHADTFSTATDTHSHTENLVVDISHGHADTFAVATGNHDHVHGPNGGSGFWKEGNTGTSDTQIGAFGNFYPASIVANTNTASVATHGHGLTGGVTSLGPTSKGITGSINDNTHSHTINGSVTSHFGSSGPTGAAGVANDNFPPYVTVNYLIKL